MKLAGPFLVLLSFSACQTEVRDLVSSSHSTSHGSPQSFLIALHRASSSRLPPAMHGAHTGLTGPVRLRGGAHSSSGDASKRKLVKAKRKFPPRNPSENSMSDPYPSKSQVDSSTQDSKNPFASIFPPAQTNFPATSIFSAFSSAVKSPNSTVFPNPFAAVPSASTGAAAAAGAGVSGGGGDVLPTGSSIQPPNIFSSFSQNVPGARSDAPPVFGFQPPSSHNFGPPSFNVFGDNNQQKTSVFPDAGQQLQPVPVQHQQTAPGPSDCLVQADEEEKSPTPPSFPFAAGKPIFEINRPDLPSFSFKESTGGSIKFDSLPFFNASQSFRVISQEWSEGEFLGLAKGGTANFGFIRPKGTSGPNIFVHKSNIHDEVQTGDVVKYQLAPHEPLSSKSPVGDKNEMKNDKLQAVNVRRADGSQEDAAAEVQPASSLQGSFPFPAQSSLPAPTPTSNTNFFPFPEVSNSTHAASQLPFFDFLAKSGSKEQQEQTNTPQQEKTSTQEEEKTTTRQQEQPKNDWRCTTCLVMNKDSVMRCVCCEAENHRQLVLNPNPPRHNFSQHLFLCRERTLPSQPPSNSNSNSSSSSSSEISCIVTDLPRAVDFLMTVVGLTMMRHEEFAQSVEKAQELISIARPVEPSQPRDLTEILIFSTSALSRLVDFQVPYLETPSGVVARVPGAALNVKILPARSRQLTPHISAIIIPTNNMTVAAGAKEQRAKELLPLSCVQGPEACNMTMTIFESPEGLEVAAVDKDSVLKMSALDHSAGERERGEERRKGKRRGKPRDSPLSTSHQNGLS
ncbi:hypothetical protein GUITHDRAFT_139599 [Guillardia theta CCMP2712]|uniref:RanBP2-type domain-containing protein n=1 Tax=Guillardia theta (strain CCMP2712) TaxID=905079 RepID=L1J813_GUITC|nr:hypothetical protein GUITHDRAFT_139599 [Guillardia theta CCMP2712]EKX44671.1 hypothetical protein GUITHDRAFT_139599 [Guillardia theta CCMP2712]|eukprot:XP_005831651.1 hypothetical protein GUITHDRAFT_139599 [Guillardia theta CCMP2712]